MYNWGMLVLEIRMKRTLLIIIVLAVLLVGCGDSTVRTPTLSGAEMAFTQVQLTVQAALTEGPETEEPAAPTPTSETVIVDEVTATPQPTTAETQAQETTEASIPTEDLGAPCLQAGFVEDRTIQDGTQLLPGQAFTKTWRLINLGSCVWTPEFKVVFNSGNAMGAEAALPFTAIDIPTGAVVDISIEMVAPATPGSYQGYWMLKSANGEVFGTVPGNTAFYVDIEVVSPTATPTEAPLPTDTPTPTNTTEPVPTDE